MTASADHVSPRVSIAMVSANHEQALGEALDGIFGQRMPFTFDLIAADVGSTDQTRNMLIERKERAPDTVRVLFFPAGTSHGAALARSLSSARGEYIALADADDRWISPTKLHEQASFLDEHPECALSFHDADVATEKSGEHRVVGPRKPQFIDGLNIPGTTVIPRSTAMMRRAALLPLPRALQDNPFPHWRLYELAGRVGSFGYIDKAMTLCRERAGRRAAVPYREYHDYGTQHRVSVDLGDRDVTAILRFGHIWTDGWCTPLLGLRLTSTRPLRSVRLTLWNPDTAPSYVGNRVNARIAGQDAVADGLAAGSSFDLNFKISVPARKSFDFDLSSAVEHRPANDLRVLGVVLLGINFGSSKD